MCGCYGFFSGKLPGQANRGQATAHGFGMKLLLFFAFSVSVTSMCVKLSAKACSAKSELLKYLQSLPATSDEASAIADSMVRAKVESLLLATEPDPALRHVFLEQQLRSAHTVDGTWTMLYSTLNPLNKRVQIRSLFMERAMESEENVMLTAVSQIWQHLSHADASPSSLLLPMGIDNCLTFLFEKARSKSLLLHRDVPGCVVTRGYCLADPFAAEREPGAVRLRTVWHEQDACLLSLQDDGHSFDSLVGLPHDGVVVTKLSHPLHSDSWLLYLDESLRVMKGSKEGLIILTK